jgi:hypothetical protein
VIDLLDAHQQCVQTNRSPSRGWAEPREARSAVALLREFTMRRAGSGSAFVLAVALTAPIKHSSFGSVLAI